MKALSNGLPTIDDVAQKAGVSIATVSRVFNDKAVVKAETRRKVMEAVKALNYFPNLAARALTLQKTDTLGVIFPDLGGEFFSELIHSIDEVAYKRGYHIIISASHSHRSEAEALLRMMTQGRVDGLILMVPILGKLSLPILNETQLPIVILNLPDTHSDKFICIQIDNFRGAFLVTKHLLEHGYQRLAIIRGPQGNFDADERERGFRAALSEKGIVLDQSYLERSNFKRRSGYFAMTRLLSLPQPPQAVFASNDEMAIGAVEAARRLGVRIPGQLALAGFDDIAAAEYLRPALTTVHVPIVELGTVAAQQLIDAIKARGANAETRQKHVLPTGLVIRESCGCLFQSGLAERAEGR